jgi:hypothetical protein
LKIICLSARDKKGIHANNSALVAGFYDRVLKKSFSFYAGTSNNLALIKKLLPVCRFDGGISFVSTLLRLIYVK